jgi:hypothetical protein
MNPLASVVHIKAQRGHPPQLVHPPLPVFHSNLLWRMDRPPVLRFDLLDPSTGSGRASSGRARAGTSRNSM